MTEHISGAEEVVTIRNVAGIILGLSENRVWIELFFDGDLMHTQTVNLPTGVSFDIYVEEIPHKTTVLEHPRTMIFFASPCNLRISREGNRVMVKGGIKTQGES
jgi:hypothetical protein